jgi:hypothetical protein
MNPINHDADEQKIFQDRILESVKSGQVKMRPRWYFLLRDILGIVAIVIILLIAVYLASFIIFVLHENGAWFVPFFGLAGWYSLFVALPWVLVILSCIFVVALAILARRYQLGYQWPFLYSVLGTIFLIAAVCFIFVQTSFYNTFFGSSVSHEIPFLGEYYPGIGILQADDIHRGEVVASSSLGFTMDDSASGTLLVVVASSTQVPFDPTWNPGDMVVVFGDVSPTGTIKAIGVEKIAP